MVPPLGKIIRAADMAMCRAKNERRDRVVIVNDYQDTDDGGTPLIYKNRTQAIPGSPHWARPQEKDKRGMIIDPAFFPHNRGGL
jgi:hypothetical protein